ncbi:SymE family type I addiction module toxin [Salmonella enterica]|uniref:Type I toxin-antitoxin system SymE family toxin n=2 Tax=Salmonella enterica TaxID=28901 RepID=A0A740VH59_SALET|nr:type I addiction module toxin, SymE family [Salmonella enterica]EBP3476615.1 type I toxin-antitoxin system SymE family toxin [Salmonella enterica subsp. enterica]ECC3104525.1 type I addiction module toxin, SymE family [Salmonella enterica subsp. arizonae]HAE8120729.1 type I toxin-antitoxin system SymE family toxin [Salmonella enterica subsp. arizonae serovar 18:z4,z32:-]HAF0406412.1 type I toxin-antitoxin system SymE family toxin [Salmonella enterica subsp. enterica serovar 6,7:c:1,5]
MIKISLCRDLSLEPQTKIFTRYSQSPSLHFKGDWLKEAEFDTGRGVTVRITVGCLAIIADNNEVQELREELYKVKQVVKGMRDGVFSVLNDSN